MTAKLENPEPVPAWAVQMATTQACWTGRWAGCSDILAMLVRRLPEDVDTRAPHWPGTNGYARSSRTR